MTLPPEILEELAIERAEREARKAAAEALSDQRSRQADAFSVRLGQIEKGLATAITWRRTGISNHMIRSIDLFGLSIDVALAVVAASLDGTINRILASCQAEWAAQGADEEMIAVMMERQRAELQTMRAQHLTAVGAWLIEGGGGRLH
jgi:hypothetical protein